MLIGIAIEETWAFFTEVEQELAAYHQVSQFHWRPINTPLLGERINRQRLRVAWLNFLQKNQVVFFEWASGMLATASQLPKTCGIVTRLHRYEMYKWADQIHWDSVDRIILVSKAKKREFDHRFPTQAGKSLVIPEAISFDRFIFQPKEFQGDIGILCHLSPRKRVYELILAFYELNRSQPDFHLHIGGGPHPGFPDYYTALQSLVSNLGLQNRVTFYGNVQDAPNWYRKVDIFISNSYSEGLQVSPMEAIASGCYCLSHRWDGAEELFPKTALFHTERELIEKILAYSNQSQADKLGQIAELEKFIRQNHDLEQIKVQIRSVVEAVGQGYIK